MPRNVFNVIIDKIISVARVKVRDDADTVSWDIDTGTGYGSVAVRELKPDGANTMPAGDAPARAVFSKITDGAETASVDASSRLETAEANSGDIKTAVEAMQGTVDGWDDSGRCGIQGGNTSDVKISLDGEKVGVNDLKPDGSNAMPAGDDPARALHAKFVPERPASDLGSNIIIFNHGTVIANWSTDCATAVTQNADYDLWITEVDVVATTDPTAEIQTQEIPFELVVKDVTDNQYRNLLFGGIPGNTHFSFNTPLKIERNHQWRTDFKLGGATNICIYITVNGFEEA